MGRPRKHRDEEVISVSLDSISFVHIKFVDEDYSYIFNIVIPSMFIEIKI